MAKSEINSSPSEVGPSIILGLVGAVVVLVVLGAGIWGVGKIISKVRESSDEEEQQLAQKVSEGEETVSETTESQGDVNGDGITSEGTEEATEEDTTTGEVEGATEETTATQQEVHSVLDWVANDYKSGDITGENYTVVWGDTLWEIAEAKYGSGFEWGKIRDANLDIIGFLPDGSRALIFPGQVLALP